jgi:hypothetical protein
MLGNDHNSLFLNKSKKMTMNKFFLLGSLAVLVWACSPKASEIGWIAQAPAGNRYAVINKTGESIIPNGRIIQPAGKTVVVAPHPYGLTLSP